MCLQITTFIAMVIWLQIASIASERNNSKRVNSFPMKDMTNSRSPLHSPERKQDSPVSLCFSVGLKLFEIDQNLNVNLILSWLIFNLCLFLLFLLLLPLLLLPPPLFLLVCLRSSLHSLPLNDLSKSLYVCIKQHILVIC